MSKDIKLMIYQVKDRLHPLIILRSFGTFFIFHLTLFFFFMAHFLLCCVCTTNYWQELTMKTFLQRFTDQQGITTTMMWMCFSCAVLLVIPSSLFSLSNSDILPDSYAPYLWVLTLLTGSYLLTRVLSFSFSKLTGYYASQRLLIRRNKMILQLDFEEKALLREFIIQRKTVLALPLTEPAVSNLLASGVLAPAFETQEIKGSSRIIKLSIAIDARVQLTHRVIGLPVGKLTEAEAEVLKAARPKYARNNYIAL